MGIVALPPPIVGLTGGASDRTIVGTKTARPGGVENILEYGGALLNVRTWFDTFLVTTIEGLADADLRDSREVNPGRHGETYFNAYYGGRTIVLSGKIRALSLDKLRDMQMGLKQIFGNLSAERPLIFHTGDVNRDVMIYCKKSQPIVMSEVQSDYSFRRDFQVTLRASNPRFLAYMENRFITGYGYYEPFATPATVQNANLLLNPSCEVNVNDGGMAGANSSSVRSTAQAANGVASWLMTATAAGNASLRNSGLRFSVTPGRNYYASAMYRAVATTRQCRTSIIFCDSTGAIISSPVGTAVNNTTTGWTMANVWATAPANAVTAYMSAEVVGCGAGEQHYIDSMMTTAAADLTTVIPYFDGDMVGSRWSGTPHNSTSEKLSLTGLESSWSIDSATGGDLPSVRGGALYGKNTIVTSAILNSTLYGKLANQRTTVKFTTGATLAATQGFGIIGSRVANGSYIYGYLVSSSATAGTIRIMTRDPVNGFVTKSATPAITLAANTAYWLRLTINGNICTIDFFTADPALGGAPAVTTNYTLTGTDATTWGAGIAGDSGLRILNTNADWAFDDFTVEALSNNSVVAFTAPNDGNIGADPKFRVYGPLNAAANAGPAGTIRCTAIDTITGDTITGALTINAKAGTTVAIPNGNYMEIDADTRTIKEYQSDGTLVGNAFAQLDVASDWIELIPGQNPIEFQTYAASRPQLELRYRDSYL